MPPLTPPLWLQIGCPLWRAYHSSAGGRGRSGGGLGRRRTRTCWWCYGWGACPSCADQHPDHKQQNLDAELRRGLPASGPQVWRTVLWLLRCIAFSQELHLCHCHVQCCSYADVGRSGFASPMSARRPAYLDANNMEQGTDLWNDAKDSYLELRHALAGPRTGSQSKKVIAGLIDDFNDKMQAVAWEMGCSASPWRAELEEIQPVPLIPPGSLLAAGGPSAVQDMPLQDTGEIQPVPLTPPGSLLAAGGPSAVQDMPLQDVPLQNIPGGNGGPTGGQQEPNDGNGGESVGRRTVLALLVNMTSPA